MKTISILGAVAFATLCASCKDDAPPAPAAAASTTASSTTPAAVENAKPAYTAVDRLAFNQAAVRLNLPLYWAADANKNGAVDPSEVRTLLFYPTSTSAKWVTNGAFTKEFDTAYASISKSHPPTDPREVLVAQDLDGAAASLVESDLTKLSAEEKAFAQSMLEAAALIDDLYATQNGSKALAKDVPADAASQSLFRRNWGPKCVTPKVENDPKCTAIPNAPKQLVDVYPADMQKSDTFCKDIEARPDAKTLLTPFVAVRAGGDKGDKLTAVAFSEAYKPQMTAIAAKLNAAAVKIADPNEAPLKAYLTAVAQSFTTNDWNPSDEAWAKMNAENSKWYLRIGPDETYWEPCDHKAGFHMTFARINADSLAWQNKLKPVQKEMETTLATLIGAPYKARDVSFHLPDFIDIVLNAGDDRNPVGGTIGQSLPNWGPVSARGAGRTVAMSNLYADPDSMTVRHKKADSLFTKEAMAVYSEKPESGLLSTILHEATHNLGPAHEYTYQGKTDATAFGGGLASMMEELKAQSGGLYYIDFALQKKIITPEFAKQTYLDEMVWAMNHISRGMYSGTGHRKPYSQLAAIQVGFLMDEKALIWDANAMAANGTDKGAFTIVYEKFPAACEKLMKIVGGLKASADAPGANKLADQYVKGDAVPQKVIAERLLRFPQPNFVYAVDM